MSHNKPNFIKAPASKRIINAATRSNNFVSGNTSIKNARQSSSHHKCGHHTSSYNYANNMAIHNQIVNDIASNQVIVDMNTNINVKIAFHLLAPLDSFTVANVTERAFEIVSLINDDFNNYSSNPNTMNNFKYKSVVNQVFFNEVYKQNTYLSQSYLDVIPMQPSNITFELGQIYYYPVTSQLNLGQYDDIEEVELEFQAIKQFINQNNAVAIGPENFLNIWIVDMSNTEILGFSSFPWEPIDSLNGIIVNRNVFFPEQLTNNGVFFPYDRYKTFTHEIGHYFGLLHIFNTSTDEAQYAAINLNDDTPAQLGFNGGGNYTGDYIADTPIQTEPTYDPTDPVTSEALLVDPAYNPLFMNFMDLTYDKYITNFTYNQVQKMRYMIFTYRPLINNNLLLPVPKFNPVTRTTIGAVVPLSDISSARRARASRINHNPAMSYPSNYVSTQYSSKQVAKYDKYGLPARVANTPITNDDVQIAPKKRFTRTRPLKK